MDNKRLFDLQHLSPAELLKSMAESKAERAKPLVTKNQYEAFLAKVWGSIFPQKSFNTLDNFFDLGGTSLQCVLILSTIKEHYHLELDLIDLFKSPTIEQQAKLIDSLLNSHGTLVESYDYLADINKVDLIDASQAKPFEGRVNRIFLTGVTGFLGIHLLKDLLLMSNAHFYCLIRAEDKNQGKKRILSHAKKLKLTLSKDEEHRIHCICGSLELDKLGMSDIDYDFAINEIDLIIHSAAQVNFIYPYEALRSVNVISLLELMRIASLVKIKPIHFISTIGVFADSATSDQWEFNEQSMLPANISLNGYFQTKLVCEKMCLKARAKGIPVAVYRPSGITMNSATNVVSDDDLTFLFVKLSKATKSLMNIGSFVDSVPVDYVAHSIAQLVTSRPDLSSEYHLVSGQNLSSNELIQDLPKKFKMDMVSPEEFIKRSLLYISNSKDEKLKSIVPLLYSNMGALTDPKKKMPLFLNDQTKSLIKEPVSKPDLKNLLLKLFELD